jgi:hypothetical protein
MILQQYQKIIFVVFAIKHRTTNNADIFSVPAYPPACKQNQAPGGPCVRSRELAPNELSAYAVDRKNTGGERPAAFPVASFSLLEPTQRNA